MAARTDEEAEGSPRTLASEMNRPCHPIRLDLSGILPFLQSIGNLSGGTADLAEGEPMEGSSVSKVDDVTRCL